MRHNVKSVLITPMFLESLYRIFKFFRVCLRWLLGVKGRNIVLKIICDIYTLFDGLAYNTCGYFASCVVNTSNEQNVRSYYMLNHRIRGLLFHYKKLYFAIGFYFLGKSIQKHPDSICENDVNNEQTVRAYYAKPLNERLIILHKKTCYFRFYFLFYFHTSVRPVQPYLLLASAGIRPVVSRLNQNTTVYYGLVFCAFS